jgi:hypothetical protein
MLWRMTHDMQASSEKSEGWNSRWVKTGMGRWLLVRDDDPEEPRMRARADRGHDVNAHDIDHGLRDSPIVEDLGMPTVQEGREAWGADYVVLPDGRHGPKKFRSKAEKLRYMRLTGHVERGSFVS